MPRPTLEVGEFSTPGCAADAMLVFALTAFGVAMLLRTMAGSLLGAQSLSSSSLLGF